MAIQNNTLEFKKITQEFFQTMLFWIVCLIGLGFFFGIHKPQKKLVKCGMETVKTWQSKPYFYENGEYVNIGGRISDKFSKSGQHSVELFKEYRFGASYDIPVVKGYEKIKATVWRFADGKKANSGVIVAEAAGGLFWKSGKKVLEKTEDGWEKIEFSFELPYKVRDKKLSIYCWNPGKYPIYFDDLNIEINAKEKV